MDLGFFAARWGFFTAFLIWSLVRQRALLKYFQQHEYNGERFLRWLVLENSRFDLKLSLQLISLSLLSFLLIQFFGEAHYIAPFLQNLWLLFAPILVLLRAYLERDEHKGKKSLVFTSRARRIFWASAVCNAASLLFFSMESSLFLSILFLQLQPLFLVFANTALWIYEKKIQTVLIKEAQDKLEQMKMITIGITGSFGKTSLKHILGHILSSLDSAYMTPGSVNTVMGVTRAIREGLAEKTRVFIVEMGAYARGSIARLCHLAPPDIAIVTSIGPAHYERFKSLEEVAIAKSELPEAALQRKGRCYFGPSVSSYLPFKTLGQKHKAQVQLNPIAERIHVSRHYHTLEGLVIECSIDGKAAQVRVPIFGKHQVDNILLALLVVIDMGYSLERAIASLQSLQQIKHRLEVKQMSSGLTWIDDGFNSNPVGFCSALEFMTEMRDLKWERAKQQGQKAPGKRYLITPGMVELGSEHVRLHEKVGKVAVEHVDVLLAVCPERIAPLIKEFELRGKELHRFSSFQSACHFFLKEQHSEDVVLIENDLPDLYESPPKF